VRACVCVERADNKLFLSDNSSLITEFLLQILSCRVNKQTVMDSFGTSRRNVISNVLQKFDATAVFVNFCIVYGPVLDRR